MRYTTSFIASLFIITIAPSCKKDKNSNSDCFPNSSTVRQINNAQATVKKAGEKFYIVEQGSIDTKLNPCTLPQEFQIDNLQVTISGDVKSTIQSGPGPCCTENFVIAKISR
jgi:hypothetical protein